ncbi:LTA synthase family protein [Anaerosporobacter faecicola]|uniref:LTA synthase family protein n=1 Tax=Anaerosporobacter faecicola TaxID=2718714 RepID=UPI00143C29AF|nr:LTA synthase family protein [Anaerosporobacter faecicola]
MVLIICPSICFAYIEKRRREEENTGERRKRIVQIMLQWSLLAILFAVIFNKTWSPFFSLFGTNRSVLKYVLAILLYVFFFFMSKETGGYRKNVQLTNAELINANLIDKEITESVEPVDLDEKGAEDKNKKRVNSNREKIDHCLKIGKVLIAMLFLYGMKVNYRNENICQESTESFTYAVAIFAFLAICWIYPQRLQNLAIIKKIRGIPYVFYLITPIIGMYLVEYVTNPDLNKMSSYYIHINLVLFSIALFIFVNLIGHRKGSLYVYYTVALLIGLADHYIYIFRGKPIVPPDFYSLGTAYQVAGNYNFAWDDTVLRVVLLFLACLVIIQMLPKDHRTKKQRMVGRGCAIGAILLVVISFHSVSFKDQFKVKMDYWTPRYTYYRSGFVLSFLTMFQNMQVKEPANYSSQVVDEIYANQAETTTEEYEKEEYKKPTVIAIMNETFSNLAVLKEKGLEQDCFEKWDAITNCMAKGNLYVSTIGGGTCNTEFEFLTGNTIGNLPYGANPYELYNMKGISNLAQIFHKNGYETLAIHPAAERNWNRKNVYRNFTFDRFLSLKDFDNPVKYRNLVSDRSCYDKVIEEYEAMTEPGFIFNVTIQNHSGYDITKLGSLKRLEVSSEIAQYPDLVTYLTVINESVNALEDLLAYFREVDEPVIICFFGDHQPHFRTDTSQYIYSELSSSIQDCQKKYTVPYLIWSNQYTGEEQNIDMSANYLGAYLLEQAGVKGTSYTNYLRNLQKDVSAINAFGYMKNDGIWHAFDETTTVSEQIKEYKIIQYNSMFDEYKKKAYYQVQE